MADRDVSLLVGDLRICVFEWVDVLERDPNLDPVAVGRLVASIHRVPFPEIRGEDPWYRRPITDDRWDGLTAAGAPFADELASYRGELAVLGALVEPPTVLQTCHRDLLADNLRATPSGGLCVLDWENFGLAETQARSRVWCCSSSAPERPDAHEISTGLTSRPVAQVA